VIPEEGGSLWVDGLAIAKGAPNQDAAYEFISFLLRPEIAAMATNDGGLASANQAAQEHVSDQGLLSNAAVYASEEQVAQADFIVDPGEAMKFYQDGWTRVKAS
jgi:spermidine/putrescine transport system substrate-binding protein